ncbi:IclR family transcriptional regulator [Kitasatospora herbaricolor]|nr:DNA-binding IclR family transcriptional regulator [Kitasatospora herbaricolor]GGV47797.1 IclR family transcriptional regulator [Kitasatospora herbaricolor]
MDNMSTEEQSGRGPVKSAERVMLILEALAASPCRLTLGQLHERTGYPRSSLHALLRTMVSLGWLESSVEGDTVFGVGPHALLCGTAYLDRDPVLRFAVRQLELLRTDVGYTTHYARLYGPNVIYLATREATDSHRLISRVGRQLPAHATALGKALLSELTPSEVARVLPDGDLQRLTEHTVGGLSDLSTELDATRRNGWALEREQSALGVWCVAAPVPYRIPANDAISCAMPLTHVSDQEIARVGNAVRRHCDELAKTLRREGIR